VLAMIAIIKPEDALTRELEDRMNINHELNKRIGTKAKTARMAELKAQIEDGTYDENGKLDACLPKIHAAVTKDQEQ
jgi:mevalonate kinase